jgi:hypothetical protein
MTGFDMPVVMSPSCPHPVTVCPVLLDARKGVAEAGKERKYSGPCANGLAVPLILSLSVAWTSRVRIS